MEKKARRLLAQKLRLLRLTQGWSQEYLAEASGLDRSYVSSIERTERNIGLDNVEKLADAFGLTLSELLGTPDAADVGKRLLEILADATKKKGA